MVREVLEAGLVQLAAGSATSTDVDLRIECRTALERLWDRRDALARVLQRLPGSGPTVSGRQRDTQSGELHEATMQAAQALSDAARAALPARQQVEVSAGEEWPYSPERWASALRHITERSSSRHAVRIELLRFGATLLSPLFVDSWRRAKVLRDASDAGPGGAEAAGEAVPNVGELLAAMLPGFRLRMMLMGQWTDVCVTWRSTNGHFFSLSSEVAGRSHSIGRRGIERLIAKRHVRVPEDSLMAERRAARGQRLPLVEALRTDLVEPSVNRFISAPAGAGSAPRHPPE
ncbi:hypothetical protein [Variovorax sp. YR752]|uniref:hypothetical protein n=1 Tax=Variovorax sp. YR752 TaxID=1884383 RepID=UPI0031382E43